MKSILLALLVLVPSVSVMAEEAAPESVRSPEALKILEKADAAIKAVHSVRYRVKTTPEGSAEQFAAPAEGTAVLSGWSETARSPEAFYAHVKTTKRGSDASLELTGGGNGDTFFVIDHDAKKGYEDMDPNVMGGGGTALGTVQMMEFVHHAPFDDELGAEAVTLEGEESVEGEACYKINVKYSGGRGESIWLISKADSLPRGRTQIFDIPDLGKGKIETVVSALEVNVDFDPGLFRMKLPEGYEQVDDFMP